MNAVEFVKKFGIDKAKDLACRDKTSIGYLSIEHHNLNQEELKQIVDAWELVEAWGGIDRTKDRIEWAIVNKNYYAADMMKHSINLVEQCNA